MESEVSGKIAAAQKAAEKIGTHGKSKPDLASMFDDVFEEMPWHLREQREQALMEEKATQ